MHSQNRWRQSNCVFISEAQCTHWKFQAGSFDCASHLISSPFEYIHQHRLAVRDMNQYQYNNPILVAYPSEDMTYQVEDQTSYPNSSFEDWYEECLEADVHWPQQYRFEAMELRHEPDSTYPSESEPVLRPMDKELEFELSTTYPEFGNFVVYPDSQEEVGTHHEESLTYDEYQTWFEPKVMELDYDVDLTYPDPEECVDPLFPYFPRRNLEDEAFEPQGCDELPQRDSSSYAPSSSASSAFEAFKPRRPPSKQSFGRRLCTCSCGKTLSHPLLCQHAVERWELEGLITSTVAALFQTSTRKGSKKLNPCLCGCGIRCNRSQSLQHLVQQLQQEGKLLEQEFEVFEELRIRKERQLGFYNAHIERLRQEAIQKGTYRGQSVPRTRRKKKDKR